MGDPILAGTPPSTIFACDAQVAKKDSCLATLGVYMPPGIWHQIGMVLLEANDLHALRNLCTACKDAHRALGREFTDLFCKPVPLLAFRSQYIKKILCHPFVSTLKRLLSEMQTSQRRTSLLVIGGTGDVVETVVSLMITEQASCAKLGDAADGNMELTQTVVINCNNCNECDELRRLTNARRDASRNGIRMQPIMLVLLGVQGEAWSKGYVRSWGFNYMCYKASIVFICQSYVKICQGVLSNMDKMLCINGIRFS